LRIHSAESAEQSARARGRHVRQRRRHQPRRWHVRAARLPIEAQLAPIYASLAGDFDGDGKIDLVVAGNFYGVTPREGRYDASYGLLLHGDGHGGFTAVDMEQAVWRSTGRCGIWRCFGGPPVSG